MASFPRMKIAGSLFAADSRAARVLRAGAWNVLILLAALALAGVAGEAYFRHAKPFMKNSLPSEFVPGVGLLRKPSTEMRYTNGFDFWTVQRSNSLGFLDREPTSLKRADAGCRVVVMGDSNVEAREVQTDDKLHVRLEDAAAKTMPGMKISATAFGRGGTGQVQQLAFYDEYARHLRPALVVLVFVPNDFMDNSPVLSALLSGWDPDHVPAPSVRRDAEGNPTLRPPQADFAAFRLGADRTLRRSLAPLAARVRDASWLAGWLEKAGGVWFASRRSSLLVRRAEALRRRPAYATLLAGWEPTTDRDLRTLFARDDPPPVVREAVEYTTFALRQFKARADSDGARLVVLASHRMAVVEPPLLEAVQRIAAAVGVPVVDQAEYIVRQGARLEDAQWRRDAHWNVAGHQWAAEALLEYVQKRPEVCDGGRGAR